MSTNDNPTDINRICPTPGCAGDGRYSAPGRGHATGCKYPLDNPTDDVIEAAVQILSDEGAMCGDCGDEPGDRDCTECERYRAGYARALAAAGLLATKAFPGDYGWGDLMTLLDAHWPADIFGGTHVPVDDLRDDDCRRDAGVRIAALVRWVDHLLATRTEGDPLATVAGRHYAAFVGASIERDEARRALADADARLAAVRELAGEDDAFGDLVGDIAALLRGQVASAVNGTGSSLVTIERCYASGIAQRVTRLVQDRLRAVLDTPTPDKETP